MTTTTYQPVNGAPGSTQLVVVQHGRPVNHCLHCCIRCVRHSGIAYRCVKHEQGWQKSGSAVGVLAVLFYAMPERKEVFVSSRVHRAGHCPTCWLSTGVGGGRADMRIVFAGCTCDGKHHTISPSLHLTREHIRENGAGHHHTCLCQGKGGGRGERIVFATSTFPLHTSCSSAIATPFCSIFFFPWVFVWMMLCIIEAQSTQIVEVQPGQQPHIVK